MHLARSAASVETRRHRIDVSDINTLRLTEMPYQALTGEIV